MAEVKPTSSGYADVNGIRLYHEIEGQGEPLLLIDGGLTTIGEMQGSVQHLAKRWRVIAVEIEGHVRTADTDRPMSVSAMGEDISVLLDSLRIPDAGLVGHSFPDINMFIRNNLNDDSGTPGTAQKPPLFSDAEA
jgi:pimeloyl-ACP methyl ester carboxylesterase